MQLGCCPEPHRCLLCPPSPPAPSPRAITQRIEVAELDGTSADVCFYGGPPPTPAQLAAADGRAVRVRVRPDLLTRTDAARLVEAGCVHVELDVLTLDRSALEACGRRHRPALVAEITAGLQALELEVGWVLAPGLPGTSHQTVLADALAAVDAGVSTIRLHPVVVWAASGLEELHMDGRYQPLSLAQAITTCRVAMDVLEGAGIRIIRVGQQGGPDGLGRALAGPAHASLRQLVEARRALERLQAQARKVPRGAVATIHCAPADETRVRGPRNQHIRELRAEHGLADVVIQPDPDLTRGTYEIRWVQGE